MPAGHAMTAFATAAVLSREYPRLSPVFYGLALWVGLAVAGALMTAARKQFFPHYTTLLMPLLVWPQASTTPSLSRPTRIISSRTSRLPWVSSPRWGLSRSLTGNGSIHSSPSQWPRTSSGPASESYVVPLPD